MFVSSLTEAEQSIMDICYLEIDYKKLQKEIFDLKVKYDDQMINNLKVNNAL